MAAWTSWWRWSCEADLVVAELVVAVDLVVAELGDLGGAYPTGAPSVIVRDTVKIKILYRGPNSHLLLTEYNDVVGAVRALKAGAGKTVRAPSL